MATASFHAVLMLNFIVVTFPSSEFALDKRVCRFHANATHGMA
jgi:hypothetical protein